MAIQEFTTQAQANAVPGVKHIRIRKGKFIVLTGVDIPAKPVIELDAYQFRAMLRHFGHRTRVDQIVNSSGDADLKDLYEYKSFFRSDHPKVIEIGAVLGLTQDQIYQMFQFGLSIE